MTETCLPIVTWLKNWFYSKTEIDTELDGKSDTGHTHTLSDITDYPTDTNWAEISYRSGYSRYGTNNGVYYRRKGKTIELSGVWTTSANRSATLDTVIFGSIPSTYAPSRVIRVVMQGSQLNRYMLTVNTDGTLAWSRYGTTSSSQLPSGVWGVVYCTWTK